MTRRLSLAAVLLLLCGGLASAESLRADVRAVQSRTSLPEDAACRADIDARPGPPLASSFIQVAAEQGRKATGFYVCAYAGTTDRDRLKAGLFSAALARGLACTAWKPLGGGESLLTCKRGEARKPGYWALLTVDLVPTGAGQTYVLFIAAESQRLAR